MAVKLSPIRVVLDRAAKVRFRREIAVLLRLSHSQIVRLFDFGTSAGFSFLVTEYCNAGTLDSFVARQGERLKPTLAAAIMEPCLAAVAYAHEQGIVHRDIKPRNILLDDQSGRLTPKIADFGIAKANEEAGMSGLTLTGDPIQ